MIIEPANDPMGQAIDDFFNGRKTAKLFNSTQYTCEDEFPIDYLFRTWDEMPKIEKTMLNLAQGDILDVGAAAGAHSLHLQEKGLHVTALDNSRLSANVMKARGIQNVELCDFFDYKGKFDTILLLMNGIGICGTLDKLPNLLKHCKTLLKPNAQILFDSSDLIYLFTDDDGSCEIDLNGSYYGEVIYKMRYRRIRCNPFKWLYVDYETIASIAKENGFNCELIVNGDHFDYGAKLTLKD